MSSPALVVCGPQTSLPSTQYLTRAQQSLAGNPKLAGFVDAINDLPRTWNTLIKTDDRLQAVSGRETIEALQQFVERGRFPKTPEASNNTLFSSLTVIFEIAEYFNFLESDNSHAEVLKTAGSAGIQGFCTGFLAAAALACSKDDDEIIRNASVALRLAFAVGAFVDLSATSEKVACLTARWRDNNDEHHVAEVLKHYPAAYVSVVPDTKSVTITTPKATVMDLSQSLTARGLFSKTIELEGLYHTLALTEALEKLLALSASDKSLQFGNAPLVPLRSNVDGQIIGQSSLQHTALGILLTEVSRWDTTLLNALTDMTDHGHKTVLTLGPMDSVPALTLRELGADIIIASGSKTLVTDCLQSNFTTPGLSTPGRVETPEYQYPVHAVAIVGMGCRFPGADSVEEFWELLSAGTSMVRNIPSERFPTKGLRRTPRLGPENFWGNFLSDPDTFDHKFFKKSSREAQQMDPQQRLLLEVAYEALLSSGYFGEHPNDSQADTGIYLGVGATDYDDNVGSHPPNAFSAVGTLRAFLSGKLSHYFGWTGPSITYDTACSSSAVALHSACRAIASGECSRALAGGANVITSPKLHQNLAAASFLSPTGATKAFDAKADGYCRGEGVGLVVLKRLSDAIAEGDNVLGVIAGSAVNQNSNESAITVPHSPSQVKLYKKAAALAGIDTRDVSFVEAHGTGTPVGDPIEYESIKDAFGGPQRDSTLYLGSVKANVGHCEAASGIAALIKVILMLQHGQIPVQANFSTLNPKIKSCESDLIEIPRKTQTWETNFRAACINNYGAAGSNGTLVVCQAPTIPRPRTAAVAPRYPIFISAHSEPSLKSYCGLLSDVAAKSDLADVAFNLADKESHFLPQNLVTTAATAGELQGKLSATKLQSPVSMAKPLILTFSGQTSNVVGLSQGVYNGSTIFQRHLDQCDSVLRSFGLPSLYPGIFSTQPIDDLVSLHTKLFAFQYANAMSWIDCGLHIDAVMGHSFGQLTALCVSGSLSLVDVIKLLAGRAALMQTFWGPERGAMIHVNADVATVNKLIASTNALGPSPYVSVACFNGPSSQVLVGRESSINQIEHALTDPLQFAGRIKFQRLTTTHGFHSEFTEPILGRLSELAEQLEFNSPRIPLETCTEGQSWSKIEARCISEHTRQPVYFEEAVRRLSDRYGPCTWLGVGPGSAIIKMVGRAQEKSISSLHSLLPVRLDGPDSLGVLADVTVNLWTLGHRVQYWPFHRCQKASYTPVTLPPYQFEKSRHWLEYVDTTSSKVPETAPTHGAAEPVTLISLAHGRSKTAREAVFKIDQRSEEFRIITTGHAVVGNPLCPMSLYVELASRAALIMRPNSDQVANVENLEIRSPLGMSTERSITLTLRQAADDVAVWTFTLESKPITPDVKAAIITSHASGKIGLHAPTHQSLLNDFSRFERLVDYQLYKALTTDSSAESMQGAVIYKMFDLVVHYADYYHGVKSISSKDNRVAGRVSMPRNQKALDETITHPLAVDNFLQVAGLQVNSLSDCGPNEVFVASQIDQIQPGSLFNSKGEVAQSWDVFSSFSRSGGKEVINDIFVFDPVDKRLLMFILGAHFTKVSTLSLVKVLATVNSNKPTSAPRVATSAAPLHPKAKREEIEAPVPAPVESTKHLKSVPLANAVLQVLNKVADVPIEEESKDATFEDLGIDSLMINEVLSELRDFFAVDIPMAEFQSLQNCRSLCAYLEGKGACSPDSVSSDTSPVDSPLESSNASSVAPDDFVDEMETKDSEASDVSGKLAQVIAEHLELPTESLTNGSNLADEGLDSLLGLEIISDIAEKLQVTITAADLTRETTFGGLAAVLVERRAGTRSPAAKKELRTVAPAPSTAANSGTTPTSRPTNPDATPSVENAAQTFLENSKYAYDPFARQLGFADFWTKVYPTETRLVVRYVVDAFEYLGCPITSLVAGQEVSVKRSLAKWWLERDMGQLYNILSESGIVVKVGDRFVRTSTTIESTSASKLLSEILEKFPQHVVEHKLLDITGSQLGPCLCGDNDPLKLLFGDKATRDLLTDFYTNAPLFLAGTMVLAEFLSSVYKAKKGPGPVRILELGAGTGGTTKYIVEHLLKEGIEFEYTFTDLSSSLVATARKKFKSWGFMNFKVLDIEKTPADQFLGIYHTVLSTNCIHATKNLTNSLSNIRKTLRPDGFVSLVELTRNIPWYDLVFGLVEGWWLFNDGRAHALSGPDNWERNMKAAGFTSANWTEGSPEAETLRVVAGFQGEVPAVAGKEMELKPVSTSKKPVVETVTYKESDGLELKADIYYPADLSVSSGSRPIALMIHGGGHVMLSRKDVRRKQTQLLLDNGFLPVSIDYRLCPEVPITSGPMTDVCDALHWCRTTLPILRLKDNIAVDPQKVVVVGWSTGGHLSMTLAFTAIQRGIQPPTAIFALYCPTDYEDPCWQSPNYPGSDAYPELQRMAESEDYDLLEGVETSPILGYNVQPGRRALGGWMDMQDPRSRIALHMNWAGQALPVLLRGLPSRSSLPPHVDPRTYHSLPQPPQREIQSISPLAQIKKGVYRTPTFLVHSTDDDLIPWQQSQRLVEALQEAGVECGIRCPEGLPHLFDITPGCDRGGKGWEAILEGYQFLLKAVSPV